MKKRITAIGLSMILALTSVLQISAEDVVLDESEFVAFSLEESLNDEFIEENWTAEESEPTEILEAAETQETTELSESIETLETMEPSQQTEMQEVTELESETSGDEVDNEWTEMLLSVETVDNPETSADTGIVMETAEGAVEQSGLSENARASMLRMYALNSFACCYGDQLEGTAREIYDEMVRSYVQGKVTGTIEIFLKNAVTFQAECTKDANGKLIWNSSENVEYQQKITYAMQAAYDAFIYDYPEVFWMDQFSYQTPIKFEEGSGSYTGTVEKFVLIPQELYSGAAAENAQFEQRVSEVCSQLGINSSSSKYEIVCAVHDYLCKILTYDGNNIYAHSAAGVFLKDQRVVCEGYAKAFQILCRRYGVACILVVGNAGGAHMWNYVQMEDGNWYLVDVTWDDRVSSISRTYLLAGSGTITAKNQTIAQERSVYTNFSSAVYTQCFTVPILNETAYQPEQTSVHKHDWQLKEEKSATCQMEGYQLYVCSDCPAESRTVLEKTAHRYETSQSIDNHDATCTKDGTRTIVCDFGCGTAGGSIVVKGSATGHSFVNYQSNHDANFHTDGTSTALCEHGCGASKTVTDPNTQVRTQVTSLTLQKGQKLSAIQVTGLPAGVKVKSWKSSNTKILKVSKTGKLTAGSKTGTAKLTVTIGNGSWTDSKTITVKVQSKAVKTTKVAVNQKKVTLQKGKKHQIVTTVTPLSGEKLAYTTSDKKIAVVSKTGLVTAKEAGTAKITVKSGSKKCTVTIKVPQVKTTKLKNVPKKTLSLKKGKTKQLNIKTYPANSDQKIYYRSSNEKKVSVSVKGKLTAKNVGTVTITIKSGSVIEKFKVKVKK